MKYVLDRIKLVRKELGLRQEDMADKLGIDKSTYSQWETGKISIKLDDLHRLAKCLGVSISFLTQGEEDFNTYRVLIQRELDILKEQLDTKEYFNKMLSDEVGELRNANKNLSEEKVKLEKENKSLDKELESLKRMMNRVEKELFIDSIDFFTVSVLVKEFEAHEVGRQFLMNNNIYQLEPLFKIIRQGIKKNQASFSEELQEFRAKK